MTASRAYTPQRAPSLKEVAEFALVRVASLRRVYRERPLAYRIGGYSYRTTFRLTPQSSENPRPEWVRKNFPVLSG
jgi:hypothetical protein